jgi:transposase
MGKTSSKGTGKFQKNEKINRIFSEAFKREKVALIMQNKLTIQQCCKLYGMRSPTVYRWLSQYSSAYEKGSKMVVQLESEATKTLALQERVAELERIVGQKQLEVDYLNRMLSLLSEELGYDVKKKHAPERSSIFGSIAENITTA